MEGLPGSVVLPVPEVVMYQRPGRQIVRQIAPGAAVFSDVEQSVDNFAPFMFCGTPACFGSGDKRLDKLSLGIGQVR